MFIIPSYGPQRFSCRLSSLPLPPPLPLPTLRPSAWRSWTEHPLWRPEGLGTPKVQTGDIYFYISQNGGRGMLENTFKFYIPQFWEIKNKLRVENPKAQSHKSLSKDDASAPCPRWTVSPSNGSQTTKSGPSWRSPWSLEGLGYFRQLPVSQRFLRYLNHWAALFHFRWSVPRPFLRRNTSRFVDSVATLLNQHRLLVNFQGMHSNIL